MTINIEHVTAYNARVPRGIAFIHPKSGTKLNGKRIYSVLRRQGWVVTVDWCAYYFLDINNLHTFIRHLETGIIRLADYKPKALSKNYEAVRRRMYRSSVRLSKCS